VALTRDTGRVMRLVALVAVVIGLAALTAAACVLSYSSIHQLAIQAGVSARLASVYPLIFDALLVLAGCSVLALRGAGLVSRVYGWLCMLVLLGGLAAGGALHAAATKIPRRLAGVVAAIVPWALVLVGFGLLLALLRYARNRRLGHAHATVAAAGQEATGWPDADYVPGGPDGDYVPGGSDADYAAGGPDAPDADEVPGGPAEEEVASRPEVRLADLQLRASIPRQSAHEQTVIADEPDEPDEAGQPGSELNPAPTPDSAGGEDGGPAAFRRTRSSPTPPQE
jgi:hypothetical protein